MTTRYSPYAQYFNEAGQPTTQGQHLLRGLADLDSPVFTGVPVLPEYLVATGLPGPVKGGWIYISDASGGAVVAFSDGAAWLRCTDRTVIS